MTMEKTVSATLMRECMQAHSQAQADALLELVVQEIRTEQPELAEGSAIYIARQRIGYFAGNVSHNDRARVERLFRTAHPVFGAIRYNGPPSEAQVLKLGIEFGRLTREMQRHYTISDAWTQIAEIARVDPRRVPCERPTGLYTRALNEHGKYDQCDIATLTCDALIRYLRARGGRNVFAEAVVLQILGHELPEHMIASVRPK